MPKKTPTLWRFLLPVLLLLVLAAAILVWQQARQQLQEVERGARDYAHSLAQLIRVTDTMVTEQADRAMALLQARGLALGTPRLQGRVQLQGLELPGLILGDHAVSADTALVDSVADVFGVSATLFVKSDNDFYRVTTNIRRDDGSRALGTRLDPNGPVVAAITAGQPFQGVINILGQPYLTRYEPMFDPQGTLIGVWYVGFMIDLQVIRQTIAHARYLASGFVTVLDDSGRVRFTSSHAPNTDIGSFLRASPANWTLVRDTLEPWHFSIVVAYPRLEAYRAAWTNSTLLAGETALLGVLLLTLVLWQLRRLVIDPIGADPARAIAVVQKIAAGDLRPDALTARPGTLMDNVLAMRSKLRQTLQVLQQNAENLQLSASVFHHTHDGIFITGADGRIIEINPAFTTISGYTHQEAIGATPAAMGFSCDDPHFFDPLWQNAADWQGECQCRRKNGTNYVASFDLLAIHNDQVRVGHYVGVFSDITRDSVLRDNLEHMAYHDALTHLPNRALLSDRLQQALAQAQRQREMLAVCYFDLDDFKNVNDRYGHDTGDQLLIRFAGRMRACLRESDTIARMGGDEFALLLCNLDSTEECSQALDRLLQAISQPFTVGTDNVCISASIGYTLFPLDNSPSDTLLRHADHAMYQAKLNGGHDYHLFDTEQDRHVRGQRQVRERIERALPAGEFRLHYQPLVDMRHGRMVGAEALIRWQHPEQGLRPPGEFLPQIEHTDFIITLGEWVIAEALRAMRQWQERGLSIPVSVNIAARHLMQPNFAIRLAELLQRFPDVSPGKLELEITETAAIEDIAGVTQIMYSCKRLGVSFALDDFGVGYSSLTYLRRLPIDTVKIDQSFVRDMLHDGEDLALVAGIISLSREFNRSVIAEGVETAEHGVQLLRMGCNVVQGYGVARPMAEQLVEHWAAHYRPEAAWSRQ